MTRRARGGKWGAGRSAPAPAEARSAQQEPRVDERPERDGAEPQARRREETPARGALLDLVRLPLEVAPIRPGLVHPTLRAAFRPSA